MQTDPIVITAHGLTLREWTEDDVPAMPELFDDPEVAYRTPLESPFDEAAALRYLRGVQTARKENRRLHLAITLDGQKALGEVLLGFTSGSIGYAVGTAHRGQRLATRSLQALTEYAHTSLGLPVVLLEIEADNDASAAVARAAGFEPCDAEPDTVTDKGRTYELFKWEHRRGPEAAVAP
ncbi:RimJ/RimL family protein N-acetyltransferase [Catenulispora sp. GP43]|uniref:GNAT family N-acetyltransferase n=1 Tax=Catenulispora sp. GP43 TaxID=3156263 RepID=UPI00351569C3